jgi:uncharacterized caspase-like protein
MSRLWNLLAALVLVISGTVVAAAATGDAADKKVALVIGNSKYQHAVTLPNPTSDARMMAATLRGAGFEVVEGEDLTKAGMANALDRFTEISYDADIALIFYAGHGIQVDGKNFLIPVDTELTSPAHLKTRTVQVDDFLAAMPPDPAVGIIILDACRDNPLARTLASVLPATRSATLGSGLAPVQATASGTGTGGILIAYATDPGSVALDGKGVNSPYTAALAKYIATPGVELQNALTKVRGDVTEATLGRQRPWHNASLGREVYLGGLPDKSEPATIVLGEQPAAEAAAAPVGPSAWEIEQRLWDEASKRNTAAHYEAYLQQFPNGRFAAVAKLTIDQFKERGTQVASTGTDATIPGTGSAVRTAVAVPEEIKAVPGTEISEATLALDRTGRVDLQLRLEALGYDLGRADGSIGPRSRKAIGDWQTRNGLPPSTYLTREQYGFLVLQTDPMMAAIRARHQAEAAAAAEAQRSRKAKAQQAERAQQKQARSERKKTRRQNDDYAVNEGRVREGPVRERESIDPAGAALMGGIIGGALGAALSK